MPFPCLALDKLDKPQRWQHVCGPLGAAVATLLDWDFYPADSNKLVDPSGNTWTFDIKDPNIVASAREVLAFHFGRKVWQEAWPSARGRGTPDLSAYKALKKACLRDGSKRHLFFLDAIVQGCM